MNLTHQRSQGLDAGHLAWPFLGLAGAILIGAVILEIRGVAAEDQSGIYVPVQQSYPVVLQPAAVVRDDATQLLDRMLARPLFSSSRRPPPDTAASIAGVSTPLPRLTGVVVSSMGAFAIFAGLEGGKPVVVGMGGQVGAVVVESIAPGHVVIRGPDGIVVLQPVFGEKALQVTALDSAEPAMPGYQRPRGGHHAAFWRAAANHSGSSR